MLDSVAGRSISVAIVAALALGGCGDGPERQANPPPIPLIRTIPGERGSTPLNHSAVVVIRDWSDALRRGDVQRAASYFAIPSRAFNGDGTVELESVAAVRRFNESLPCGARLIAVEPSAHGYLIATFRLTERPGPGTCGAGSSGTARTAFRVRAGRITDWIRVGDLPQASGTAA
jgi:hypothetical protein